MPSFQLPSAVQRAAGALRDALIRPAGGEGNVALALLVYALVWTAYGTIAKGNQGLHPDMTELIAWSRELAWGYDKHGPVGAVLVWAWFSVFPAKEWTYYLLAMVMPAGTLWIMWRLSADYLAAEKRVIGVALMTFVPFFNFHALKFNVNTILLPAWALTTWWFLRSYERQSLVYAALAGLAAAVAMLTKYWSIFLLAGLAIAALSNANRGRYFRSLAPWVTVVAGFALMAPHLYWLAQNDYAPFAYAVGVHGHDPFLKSATSALGYLAGSIGYVAAPIIVVLVMARPDRATLADMAWPKERERRLVAAAFWAPFLLPVLAALGGGVEITSLWSMASFALLLVLLLSPPAVNIRPPDTERVLMAAVVFPLVMLIVSPAIAALTRPAGPPPVAVQAPRLAAEIEQIWRTATGSPLRFVGGDGDIVMPVMVYAFDRPRALLPGLPKPTDAALKRAGRVLLCYSDDNACLSRIQQTIDRNVRGVVRARITRRAGGGVGGMRSYSVVVVPPQL